MLLNGRLEPLGTWLVQKQCPASLQLAGLRKAAPVLAHALLTLLQHLCDLLLAAGILQFGHAQFVLNRHANSCSTSPRNQRTSREPAADPVLLTTPPAIRKIISDTSRFACPSSASYYKSR